MATSTQPANHIRGDPCSDESSLLLSGAHSNHHKTLAANVSSGTFVFHSQNSKFESTGCFQFFAFGGGVAIVLDNAISVLDQLIFGNWKVAIVIFHGIFLGLLIALLEFPPILSARVFSRVKMYQDMVKHYAKFLEFVWGRVALYLFVGSMQISNWNLLDRIVGGYMIVISVAAFFFYLGAARLFQEIRAKLHSEEELLQKWQQQHGSLVAGSESSLNVIQFTQFAKEAKLIITPHNIANIFTSLDKNLDDKLTFEEFQAWWSSPCSSSVPSSFELIV